MESFKIHTENHFHVQVYSWIPEKPLAVLQIVHGMMEHGLRYDHFARWMNKHQIAVYANDHIGHGLTAKTRQELGHFPHNDDWQQSVDILHNLTQRIRTDHPGIPVFLLGHSLGSVMVQTYMMQYGQSADGFILSGAIRQSGLMARTGLILSGTLSFFFGPADCSRLLIFLGYGQYNNKFRPNRTGYDWLSTQESAVDEYAGSPLCGFPCSNRFYQNFFQGFKYISTHDHLRQVPAGTSVYIFAGRLDPAGWKRSKKD
jgi:alpha-beta hydrolase superfamily lysophospholipase